jgi:hypothetical protein
MLRNKGYTVQQSNLKLATIKALVWKLLEQGGTAVVTLVVQIVMARLLAPSEFGALAIMLVFVNIGNVLVRSGLNTALIQNPDVTERDCSTVFWMCPTPYGAEVGFLYGPQLSIYARDSWLSSFGAGVVIMV